jgi:hypothetical protein
MSRLPLHPSALSFMLQKGGGRLVFGPRLVSGRRGRLALMSMAANIKGNLP